MIDIKCIHCKYNKETHEYDHFINIFENADGTLNISCSKCGMKFSVIDFIRFTDIITPYTQRFCPSYIAPDIKYVIGNLESSGLLGPEINE